MRVGLPIVALLALLALVTGVALWLSREGSTTPPGPRRTVEDAASRPGPEVREADERIVAAATPEAQPKAEDVASTTERAATAEVAGWLRLDGGPPGEKVHLDLGSHPHDGERLVVDRTYASPDGAFRFEGVAEDWSGAVLLPQHYRLADPEGNGGHAGAFPAHAGRVDLVIDVVRRPVLRGRVLGTDRKPAAEVSLLLRYQFADGISYLGLGTDPEGRFVQSMHMGPPLELKLTCRSDTGASLEREWASESIPAPDPRGDIDLGDLTLAAVAEAYVLVLDPEGLPYQGAAVSEVGSPNSRSVETDAQGRATVQLVDGLEGLEVRAVGYGLVELPRPAAGQELVARLRPTNLLEIEVVDTLGEPWSEGHLRVRSDDWLFEGARYAPATPADAGSAGHAMSTGGGREGKFALFQVPSRGKVSWPGVVAGQSFELTLEDVLGTVAVRERIAGLGPEEHRAVRLQLAREPARLSGRVLDRSGAAVPGARLHYSQADSDRRQTTTDASGVFETPPLFVESLDLRASAPGFADLQLEDVPLRSEAQIVLDRGRTLRVTLRDGAGRPFDAGAPRAVSNESTWRPAREGPGVFDFVGVVTTGLELEHTWHGRTHRVEVPDGEDTMEWELPSLGRLEVEVAPFPIGELESANLVLRALDERGGVDQRYLEAGAAWDLEFTPWPGPYQLQCVLHSYTADERGWRTRVGSRPIGEPIEIEVVAGENEPVVVEVGR